MKTKLLLLILLAAAAAETFAAHRLTVRIDNVRNNSGNILLMAVPKTGEPAYAMTEAAAGVVTLTIDGMDADTAELSVMHDENGNRDLDRGEQGIPAEGYALKRVRLAGEKTEVTLRLIYPQE